MVILDGLHDGDHVAAELEIYGPMVSVGSYLLSQDGVIDVLGVFRDSRPGLLPATATAARCAPEAARGRQAFSVKSA